MISAAAAARAEPGEGGKGPAGREAYKKRRVTQIRRASPGNGRSIISLWRIVNRSERVKIEREPIVKLPPLPPGPSLSLGAVSGRAQERYLRCAAAAT